MYSLLKERDIEAEVIVDYSFNNVKVLTIIESLIVNDVSIICIYPYEALVLLDEDNINTIISKCTCNVLDEVKRYSIALLSENTGFSFSLNVSSEYLRDTFEHKCKGIISLLNKDRVKLSNE